MFDKTLIDFYDYCCYHYSDKTAIVFGRERIKFAKLQERGLRLSNALLGLGVAKGDRLAQLMPNCPEAIISDYACCRLGLPRIPLSTYLKAESIIMMMEAAEVKVLLYDRMFFDQVKRVKAALPHVTCIRRGGGDDALPPGEHGLYLLMADADAVEPRSAPVHADDIASISFTGGTNGLPKSVVHTHRTRASVVLMELLDYGIARDEVFLAATPLTHAAGTIVLPVFLRGGCCVIMQGFDATQFLDIIRREDEDPASSRLASCGRPTLLFKVKIVGPDGKAVKTGDTGELVVKSPSVMRGYLSQPDLTADMIKDGWLHTGDMVRQDDRGYIYIVDRKKDMIVSGGFNIYPAEIENVLCGYPAVDMALVVGVPDAKWGEAVRAVVKLKPDQHLSEKQLLDFWKEKKGSVIAPKSIEFVPHIPLASLGKPDKKRVRDRYWSKRDRKI